MKREGKEEALCACVESILCVHGNNTIKVACIHISTYTTSSKTLSKPKAPELERLASNLSKARERKNSFETDITLERKEIISSFERKSSLESLAQNISEWPSPSHVRNLSFTHDGYIRHTATEMIILMTDISVIWHSTG